MDKNMKVKIEAYIAKGQNEEQVYDSLRAEGFSMFATQFHLDQFINENGEIKPVQIEGVKAVVKCTLVNKEYDLTFESKQALESFIENNSYLVLVSSEARGNENGEIKPVQIDEGKALESFGSFTVGKGSAPKEEIKVVLFKSNPDPLRGSKGVKRKLHHIDGVPHIAHRGGFRAVQYLEYNECWTWAKGGYYGGY